MFTVGYTEKHRGQNMYLYRDNDTVSFQRMTDPAGSTLTFGWEFRPVLGRRSVSPGMRQMFAVIAVPEDNELKNIVGGTTAGDPDPSFQMKVMVRTFWRRYDAKTLTTRYRRIIDDNLTTIDKRHSRMSDAVFCSKNPYDLQIFKTTTYQEALLPDIQNVFWSPIGPKKLLLSIQGNNFFTGTTVALGDKIIAPGPDLTIKSDQAIDVVLNRDDLLDAHVVVQGRYGPAIPLTAHFTSEYPLDDEGIRIGHVHWDPPIGNTITLQVILTGRGEKHILKRSELPQQALHAKRASKTLIDPIIAINGTVVPGPYDYVNVENEGVKVVARFSSDLFKNLSGVLSVKYPFLSDVWSDSAPITRDTDDFDLTLARKSVDESDFYLQRNTRDFYDENEMPGCWQILPVGSSEIYNLADPEKCNEVTKTSNATFHLLTPSLAELQIKNKILMESAAGTKNTQDITKLKFLLIPPRRPDDSLTLSISSENAEDTAQKTQLDKDQVQVITQNDSSFITFKGTELNGVKFVTVDGIDLIPETVKKNQVSVLINRVLTKQPGTLDVLIKDGTKSVIG
jgi:hypothetical protein